MLKNHIICYIICIAAEGGDFVVVDFLAQPPLVLQHFATRGGVVLGIPLIPLYPYFPICGFSQMFQLFLGNIALCVRHKQE